MTPLPLLLFFCAGQVGAVPSTPLEKVRPDGKPAFSRATPHGALAVFREDPFYGEGANALLLETPSGPMSCERPGNLACSNRVEVTTVGKLMLACVPMHLPEVHDMCVGSGKGRLLDTQRECTLIDLERRQCHLLPFLDAALDRKGTLTVLQVAWGELQRLPRDLEELSHVERLECGFTPDAGPPSHRTMSSWGPTLAVRAELKYDGTFRFVRSVDLKRFSDQDGVIEHSAPMACEKTGKR